MHGPEEVQQQANEQGSDEQDGWENNDAWRVR